MALPRRRPAFQTNRDSGILQLSAGAGTPAGLLEAKRNGQRVAVRYTDASPHTAFIGCYSPYQDLLLEADSGLVGFR